MAALASDWLRHFQLLRWNPLTEFNETWQGAWSQRPLPSLCFSGRSEKQDGRPGLWLAETFSTSPLKLLNGIQRNLTGSKSSTSSTKFVFIGPISQQKCLPWLIPPKRRQIILRCTICGPLGLLCSFDVQLNSTMNHYVTKVFLTLILCNIYELYIFISFDSNFNYGIIMQIYLFVYTETINKIYSYMW